MEINYTKKYEKVIGFYEMFFNTKLKGELVFNPLAYILKGEFKNGYEIVFRLLDMERMTILTYEQFYDMMTKVENDEFENAEEDY